MDEKTGRYVTYSVTLVRMSQLLKGGNIMWALRFPGEDDLYDYDETNIDTTRAAADEFCVNANARLRPRKRSRAFTPCYPSSASDTSSSDDSDGNKPLVSIAARKRTRASRSGASASRRGSGPPSKKARKRFV